MNVSARALVARLNTLVEQHGSGMLAFDADGTLWSGDVGEDVFELALHEQALRDEALGALESEALKYQIEIGGGANELAGRLFSAYLEGKYPERAACGMMTWCYAGLSENELGQLAERAFARKHLRGRLHRELEPVFEFARALSLRAVVVSASPQIIVERAVEFWGIAAHDVTASRAASESGRVLPRLAAPVPYAEVKPLALKALAPETQLIASFGDNVFDIELLRTAKQGVAVRPKPALRERLPELPGILSLES